MSSTDARGAGPRGGAVLCPCKRPATRRVETPRGTVWLLCDECAWIETDREGYDDVTDEEQQP